MSKSEAACEFSERDIKSLSESEKYAQPIQGGDRLELSEVGYNIVDYLERKIRIHGEEYDDT